MANLRAPISRWRTAWGFRTLADPAFQRVLLWTLIAIVLSYRAIQIMGWMGTPLRGYDFSAYWLAARHLLEGQPLYSSVQLAGPYTPQGQFLYLYPPFLAVLAMPLAWFSPSSFGPAASAWAFGGAVITVAVVLGVARLEGVLPAGERALLLLAGAFAFPPLVGELVLGNVHLVLLGLFATAWWGVRRGGSRGEALAGLAIGAAALIKLFPGLLVLWLLLTGRWRAAGWVFLSATVLILVTLPVTGLEAWLQYPGVLLNLGPPADTTDALAPSVWLGAFVPSMVARALVLVAGVVVIVWTTIRVGERASFATAVALSVLVAPALFQHYLAIMVLPLLLAFPVVLEGPPAGRIALATSYFAMWPGQQPLLGGAAWLVNRAIPTLGALGVPATLIGWGRRRLPSRSRGRGSRLALTALAVVLGSRARRGPRTR